MMIMLVVLLLFGGEKMPQMAKSLGKTIREFKRAANDVEREIKRAIDEVPDTPDIGTTLREAAAENRRKHTARLAPKPVVAVEPPPPTPSLPPDEVLFAPEALPDSPPPPPAAPDTPRPT